MTDAVFNTLVSDVVVPETFTPYIQQLTEQKSRLVRAGVLSRNALMDTLLAGGGLTFNIPSWRDLDDDDENIPTDSTADIFKLTTSGDAVQALAATFAEQLADSRPKATGSTQEVAVRLNRNQSWGSSDLAASLAGEDPMDSIAGLVSDYWVRRLQKAFIATVQGISKDNGVNDSGDYAHEVVGSSFVEGVTSFTTEGFLDAKVTMGDSSEDLSVLMVHSIVRNRMQKNNMIDFIPDARGEHMIPQFQGLIVVEDDGMPTGTSVVREDGTAGVAGMYESWMFGPGALQWGIGSPKVPTAVTREEAAGNGGGQEILYSRVEWGIHPVGHAYTGTAPNGGPSNAATTNNLNNATSWNRVYSERKQIKFARFITRES